MQIIFDDTPQVPNEIRDFVGIQHYGDIVYRRRSLFDAVKELALKAEWPQPVRLQTQADVAALVEQLRKEGDDDFYLICPSHLVSSNNAESVFTFLQQIERSPTPLHMFLEDTRGRRGWALMRAPMLRGYLRRQNEGELESFFEEQGERFVHVHDRLSLIDISDEPVLQEFLSSQFDARHFNAVERDQYTVVKRSENRQKLREEFDFYRFVPPAMQTFLVQPFDFQDDGRVARYRMERVGAPDMATQWVNGAIQPHELDRFLAHIFYFISIRQTRLATKAECQSVSKSLYVEKITSRITALKLLPAYKQLAPLLDRACGGIDHLVSRYMQLLHEARRRTHQDQLVIGHGDPCFSNIFYSKASQYLKLIDPRGAATREQLFTDPYYDLAKLSHSVQGGYDYINSDKFEIVIDEKLRPKLVLEIPTKGWASAQFRKRLQTAGFDPELVRLYEASLFISMLPLHIDRPRKVLAFAINAASILDSLLDSERE